MAPWKTLTVVMNRWRVYVVLSRQNKWLSIIWSFSRLPDIRNPPPSHPTPFSWFSEGSAASLGCVNEGPPRVHWCLWSSWKSKTPAGQQYGILTLLSSSGSKMTLNCDDEGRQQEGGGKSECFNGHRSSRNRALLFCLHVSLILKTSKAESSEHLQQRRVTRNWKDWNKTNQPVSVQIKQNTDHSTDKRTSFQNWQRIFFLWSL